MKSPSEPTCARCHCRFDPVIDYEVRDDANEHMRHGAAYLSELPEGERTNAASLYRGDARPFLWNGLMIVVTDVESFCDGHCQARFYGDACYISNCAKCREEDD